MGEGPNPGVFFVGANGNGYRLSARGVQTLQSFLREHGAECVRQFMQVKYTALSQKNLRKANYSSKVENIKRVVFSYNHSTLASSFHLAASAFWQVA